MTAKIDRLMGLGEPAETAKEMGTESVTASLSYSSGTFAAAGTNFASATATTALRNKIAPTAASQGVKLPAVEAGATTVELFHTGDAATAASYSVSIFPDTSSGTINGGSAGAAVLLANGQGAFASKLSATDWQVIRATRA